MTTMSLPVFAMNPISFTFFSRLGFYYIYDCSGYNFAFCCCCLLLYCLFGSKSCFIVVFVVAVVMDVLSNRPHCWANFKHLPIWIRLDDSCSNSDPSAEDEGESQATAPRILRLHLRELIYLF